MGRLKPVCVRSNYRSKPSGRVYLSDPNVDSCGVGGFVAEVGPWGFSLDDSILAVGDCIEILVDGDWVEAEYCVGDTFWNESPQLLVRFYGDTEISELNPANCEVRLGNSSQRVPDHMLELDEDGEDDLPLEGSPNVGRRVVALVVFVIAVGIAAIVWSDL